MKLSIIEYEEHCDSYDGFCTKCNCFTRFGQTEPDAEEYPCPDCGEDTCMGAEQALICGLLDVGSCEEEQ